MYFKSNPPITSLLVTISLCVTSILSADQRFDDESWPDDTLEEQSLKVNEGSLTFISPITDRPVLHSDIRLVIDQTSLAQGWVKLSQCYENINPVKSTDIVYRYDQIRNMTVVSRTSIDMVAVEGQVVHLNGVASGASLCITAEVNILEKLKTGEGQSPSYKITNGPYHLRFFDGYYPFHLSFRLEYPVGSISISRVSPPTESQFEVTDTAGELSFETWFEGELVIEIEFDSVQIVSYRTRSPG